MDPIDIFNTFLVNISHDHSVLLDLIISPETSFLTYLERLLQYLGTSWHQIVLQQALDSDLTAKELDDSQA